MCMWRPETSAECLPPPLGTFLKFYFFELVSLIDTSVARLGGHRAQCWDYRRAPPCLAVAWALSAGAWVCTTGT